MAAAATEEKAEALATASTPESGGGGKLTLILTAVNILATLGMAAILFVSFQRERSHPAIEDLAANAPAPASAGENGKGKEGGEAAGKQRKSLSDFGKMVTLDQFTVNLSTPGSINPKYVRVNISLEVPTDDVENEINLKMPEVRNAVIDLFNSKKPADLATADERDYLKEEIKNALNSFLVNGKVKAVFFTNFAISS